MAKKKQLHEKLGLNRDLKKALGLDRSLKKILYQDPNEITIGVDQETGETSTLNLDLFKTHLHVLGRTGKGKTRFLALLAQDLLNLGMGGCVIDVQGGLYHLIENYVAQRPKLADRVIFFNPGEAQDPVVAFNPLQQSNYLSDPQGRVALMTEAIMKHMKQPNEVMPRFKTISGNLFPALIQSNQTILESKYFLDLKDTGPRDQLLSSLPTSDESPGFWTNFFDVMSKRDKPNYLESFINRRNDFVNWEMLRYTLGRTDKLLDFDDIFNNGKLLLVNLRYPTHLSFDAATLIGICLIHELFYYAMSRHEGEAKKHPFILMIDEMQNFITPDIVRILDQCRQKGLHLVLAHQRLHQLMTQDEDLFSAVMDNALTKVIFGVSFRDAQILATEVFKFDPDKLKLELYRTAVLDNVLEYHTTRSRSTSSDTASSRQDGYARDWLKDELLSSYSLTESERQSMTETESEQIIQRPVFGEELSSVTYYPLEEQAYMASMQLKEQPVAHAYVKRLEDEPQQVKMLTVPDWPKDERLLQQAYLKSQKANPYYLSKVETRKHIETRQKQIEQKPAKPQERKPQEPKLGQKPKIRVRNK